MPRSLLTAVYLATVSSLAFAQDYDQVYYRFEEGKGVEIVDDVSGNVHGELVDSPEYISDAPDCLEGDNEFSIDFSVGGFALMNGGVGEGVGVPFIFHDPSRGGAPGDATLEWFMKVPFASSHASVIWSNADNDADANRFNISHDLSCCGRPADTITADYRGPQGLAGIGAPDHQARRPIPYDEWVHIAITRADFGDGTWAWEWYYNREHNSIQSSVTSKALPSAQSWLIAGRSHGHSFNALIDEVRFTPQLLEPDQLLCGGAPITPLTCPEAGDQDFEDTHCTGLDFDPPPGGDALPPAGKFTVTADAIDDSGDAIIYSFSAEDELLKTKSPDSTNGNQAVFTLGTGTWTITVTVDDLRRCDDSAGDSVCVEEIEVGAPLAFGGTTVAWIGFETQTARTSIMSRDDVDQAIPGNHIVGTVANDGGLPPPSVDVPILTDGVGGPRIDNLQSIELNVSYLVINISHSGVAFPFHAVEETPANLAAHQLEQGFGGLPGDATIEWFQKGSDQSGRLADGGASIFFSNGDNAFNRNRFNIQYNQGGTISGDFVTSLRDGQNQVPFGSAGTPIPLDQWVHIAIVRKDEGDGEFTFEWYVDGQLDPANTTENVGGPFPKATGWIIAGSQENPDWRGFLDEIRISDAALTPAEFLTIVPPPCIEEDDPVGQYQDTFLTSFDAFDAGECRIDVAASGVDDTFDPVKYVYELSGAEEQGPVVKKEDPNHSFTVKTPGDYTVTVTVRDDDPLIDPETGDPCPVASDAVGITEVTVLGPCPGVVGVGPFTRGDCDGNGVVGGTPTEAIVLLNYAFRGGPAPSCLAACDAEANGSIGITDALRILRFAFLGQGQPDAPFPDCAQSEAESDMTLGCEVSACTP